jgi:DNA-binding NarL/FixJ family response regulator/tetratricopeptide (TPR) repeat protein
MNVFVGRERELRALMGALDRLVPSVASEWVHVTGEPGIGKSRLLAEFAAQAERGRCLVLTGRAAELERDVPYAMFVDALDAYLGAMDAARLKAWKFDDLAELATILPSLGRLSGAGTGQRFAERYRVHRAVRGALERLAASQPVVLILDDVHWADDSSANLIHSLVHRPPVGRVLIVLSERLGRQSPLAGSLVESARDRTALEIALEGLGERELSVLLGNGMNGPARRAVIRESQGNPFYALELARAARPGPFRREGVSSEAEFGVPGGILSAVRAEIEALSATAQQVARGAAVAGDPFDIELAAACADLASDQALLGIDELVERELVHVGESPRWFVFRHPLVRRAVYESAGAGWRLGAHARAAVALAQWAAPLAVRAHHVALSARSGDLDAVEVLADAAGHAGGVAPASASLWLKAAIELLPNTPAHRGRRGALLGEFAHAQGELGHFESAHETLELAFALAPSGDVELSVRLTARLVAIEHSLGRWEQARARLIRSLNSMEDATASARAELQLELGLSHLFWMDFEAAAQWAIRSADTAGSANRPLSASAIALLAFIQACTDDLGAATAHATEAAGLLDGLYDSELAGRMDALYYLGRAEYLLEDFPAAERHLRRGVAAARLRGGSRQLAQTKIELARTLVRLGHLAEARDLTDEVLEATEGGGQDWLLGLALAAQVTVLRALGEIQGARAAGERAARLTEAAAAAELAQAIRRELALLWLDEGDPQRCLSALAAAGNPGQAAVEPGTLCLLCDALVRAELELGRLPTARLWAQLAHECSAAHTLPLSTGLARRARARVLLAEGRGEEAVASAHEAVALADQARAPIESARSRVLAAQALEYAGQRAAAVAALREAERALAQGRARGERDAVARELRRLGARAPARPQPAGDGELKSLSSREREVAELVGAGRTNREIAAAMFLSENTIETHLRRIFAKLGIRSRTALAGALERSRTAETGAGMSATS